MPADASEDYAQPGPPAPDGLQPATVGHRDMMRKAELEALMVASPQDRTLRASYFDQLTRLAVAHTGLLAANLPELGTALYFRCATPDVAVMAQVFRDEALAIETRATPGRILVIGGYAGYTSIDLGRRHPHAEVFAVEPMDDNFRLLTANTAPWGRIRAAHVAAWHSTTKLSAAQRLQADWTVRLTDEAEDGDRVVPSLSMRDLFARAGWRHADMVLVDAPGAEREIFADPCAAWLSNVDVALVRLHENLAPGSRAIVAEALPADLFEQQRHGDMELFTRRVPRTALPAAPPPISLIRSEPGLQGFGLADVAAASFGFFVFDGSSCQLHPNPPGQRPARAIIAVTLAGQTEFRAEVTHAGRISFPVVFTAMLVREDGVVLMRAATTAAPRETNTLVMPLPPLTGPARLLLQTDMAPGAGNNQMAWARWIDPTLS